MRNSELFRMKTLIDLVPPSTKSRCSPKELFSTHKKTQSQSMTPKSIQSLMIKPKSRKISAVETQRFPTRQNSSRDNKQNISFRREERVSIGSATRQAKVYKLKEQFERCLKKKQVFRKNTPLSEQEVRQVLAQMGIMKTTNKLFGEFFESVMQMLKVESEQPIAVNLFLIILAFLNIHLSMKQLQCFVIGGYEKDRSKIMSLDREQVAEIAQTYDELMSKATRKSSQKAQKPCIQINVTLPDNKRQQMIFAEDDYQKIAQRIMTKYAIPSQKLRNIQKIIQSKLKECRS